MSAAARRRVVQGPDRRGYWGAYGGCYVPETLAEPLTELARGARRALRRRSFRKRLDELLTHYAGRPTPLYLAERLSQHFGGARIYLKREDLLPTGSHRLNNALGQALLAARLGKDRLVTATASGRNGVATATAAALLGLECTVYVGAEDLRRCGSAAERMELLGARVVPVEGGRSAFGQATGEALRDWATNARHTHCVLGSVVGPHPYPGLVAGFQQTIGREAAKQLRRRARRSWPDLAIAGVGGGSAAIGLFGEFVSDSRVRLVGVEAGGRGTAPGEHAARLRDGSPGVLHGARTLVLQDEEGQIAATHSIAAGMTYPAVGPEHAALAERGRVEYTAATDVEAVAALRLLAETEGIVASLDSAHALAEAAKHAPELTSRRIVLVVVSGRGEEDLPSLLAWERRRPADEVGSSAAAAARDWSEEPEVHKERQFVEPPSGAEEPR